MKEFLFYFFIFKFYGYNNKIINFGLRKVQIKIELQNSYINYFEKYKILNFIPIEKIINIKTDNNIPILIENNVISKIEDSKLQIVSKVLKYFENNKIKIKNVDLSSKKLLDNSECNSYINDTLIKNIIKLKDKQEYIPNFYQKHIFINFLSTEFKKFIECEYFSTSWIFKRKDIPIYFQNLRRNIVDSFIKNSIYFTYSPFDKIINEENKNIKYDDEREKNYNDIILDLTNKKESTIINYDEIKNSILAFHDEGILFSIITNNNEDIISKQLNTYLYNYSQIYNEKENIIKIPIQLEKDGELLDELLKIINNNEKQRKIINSIITEKFSDFIFTRDNYLKMFLLIQRIRSNIPTIIMGETGCGKTYLIRMLSLLYSKNIKNIWTLKFHAGITDDVIIDFINKAINEVQDIEEREISKLYKEFQNDLQNDIKEKDELKKKLKKKRRNVIF